ncbi:MAG TPA: glycoside hydrolase family 1 [Clostridiales bacterium]|nr:glycoside hydrolase family 1 [Clostridiales bacterium]
MQKFDKHFLLGASTAAHQVEGNNTNSDFWAMEQIPGSLFKEPSLDAVDHYNRFREDIDLMAAAGLNAYRFSIEWARIQPTKDSFDAKEIQHYREMLEYCHQKGIKPIVTLHHFSSPKWLITEGGWEAESTADLFADYARYVIIELGDQMDYVCTINEANMGLQLTKIMHEMAAKMQGQVQVGINTDIGKVMAERMAGLSKVFGGLDPRKISHFLSGRTPAGDLVIIHAHEKARDAIKAVCPHLKVGITLSLHDFQALPGGEERAHAELDEELLHYLPHLQKDDFIGVQNYSRKLVGPDGIVPPPEGTELTQMNYEFYPQGIANVIRTVASHFHKPILVTENGIGTADDSRRQVFIQEALRGIQACLDEGIPVKGYLHWTLMDNFEWMLGFEPTFGLIAVDRTTQRRYPKPSLQLLGSYCCRN